MCGFGFGLPTRVLESLSALIRRGSSRQAPELRRRRTVTVPSGLRVIGESHLHQRRCALSLRSLLRASIFDVDPGARGWGVPWKPPDVPSERSLEGIRPHFFARGRSRGGLEPPAPDGSVGPAVGRLAGRSVSRSVDGSGGRWRGRRVGWSDSHKNAPMTPTLVQPL